MEYLGWAKETAAIMDEVMAIDARMGLDAGQRQALVEGRHGGAFELLGRFPMRDGAWVRALLPGAQRVEVVDQAGECVGELTDPLGDGLFCGRIESQVLDQQPDRHYRLRVSWPGDIVHESEDPYDFGPLLGELDLHLINEGRHHRLADALGAKPIYFDGVQGTRFAVWAPNATRVAVIGDFNSWDRRRHTMRSRGNSGVWELFVPRLGAGERYKYAIIGADGEALFDKADPVARQTECPPATASVVADPRPLVWHDQDWMQRRRSFRPHASPISIYELHVGSWRRDANGQSYGWDRLARELIPYVADLGFTHIELLPVGEHPFAGSWGYQPLGLFAPTARFGPPAAFAAFVDACHRAGMGVIVDWVPAHFPSDAHGLARFDGTALYEHADPREGFHRDWNTLIYNFGRNEVAGFLISSALEWIEHFHIDGLRVDAVASMLYRDYSRLEGEWLPNVYGGRENLEAVNFLRHLNQVIGEEYPGVMMIAEESTAWPGVSAPVATGGLGFTFKWNMGWMHDSLTYMSHDPVHRRYHHNELTFSSVYAFSEHYVLPLSHDEVVHGKGSLLAKMAGLDDWQRRATLRAYYAFMWAHPGKKLMFMGGELGQWREWDHDRELDWYLLDDPAHDGIQRALADLNRLYLEEPALHLRDSDPRGFAWVVGDDSENSVFAFLRFADAGSAPVLVVSNFTPILRRGYRLGVPSSGRWVERFNSDSRFYGGSNAGNDSGVYADDTPSHGFSASLELTLPPLATLYLRQGDWVV